MIATENQLYELERMEAALVAILISQGMSAQGRFDSGTNTTPRVELQMVVGEPVHRKIRTSNAFAPAQPFDAWLYTLMATVVTNRTENGAQHVPLIGRVRRNLQYDRLITTLTPEVSPYHTLTSIACTGQLDSVDDTGNLQMSQLSFNGIFNIRDSAWPPN